MSTDDLSDFEDASNGPDAATIRRLAATRALVCTGSGFALLGLRGWALLAYGIALCVPAAVTWLAIQPEPGPFWTSVVLVGISLGVSLCEYLATKRAVPRPPGPSFLVERFPLATCLGGLAAGIAILACLLAFRSVRMAGEGMSPTLKEGERLIYHTHVDAKRIKAGAVIVLANPADSGWEDPGSTIIARVLAIPNDEIAIEKGDYVVNGERRASVAGTGKLPVVLDIPVVPASVTVPDGCFFVVQEPDGGGFDSRVFSWVRSDDLLGTRIWRVDPRRFFQPVK